jgi:hypothetical protein
MWPPESDVKSLSGQHNDCASDEPSHPGVICKILGRRVSFSPPGGGRSTKYKINP